MFLVTVNYINGNKYFTVMANLVMNLAMATTNDF